MPHEDSLLRTFGIGNWKRVMGFSKRGRADDICSFSWGFLYNGVVVVVFGGRAGETVMGIIHVSPRTGGCFEATSFIFSLNVGQHSWYNLLNSSLTMMQSMWSTEMQMRTGWCNTGWGERLNYKSVQSCINDSLFLWWWMYCKILNKIHINLCKSLGWCDWLISN